ncbi:serpin-Z2B-like [Melitaea cinxia]|uniref:serpin-Z2B-like n=1 Tax=Melitaea cinxia TaxID=113334 RepID=UPI001E273C11|nr:serpin-Z2B-like [Melitaea cinxia]
MELLKTIFSETYWMQLNGCVSERATNIKIVVHRVQYNYIHEAILDNPKHNLVVSSLLVRFPLCKLTSVASGSSRNELLSILGIKSSNTNCFMNLKEVITPLKDIDVMLINKIILNYTNEVDPRFVIHGPDYGVRVDKVGFDNPQTAVSFINKGIERATLKRIHEVLDPKEINNKTSILVISAAYLKVTWEFPFDIRLTKTMKFRHHDGNISMLPMMSKTSSYSYLNDDMTNTQSINIKLASFGLSITIVVPQISNGLEKFLLNLSHNPDLLKEFYKRMRYETINLMLPRFKIKTNIEWNKHLKKIGLKQIFNESESGLSTILKENSKAKNMYISKMKQQSFIDVDEMGIFRQTPVRELFDDEHFHRDSRSIEMIVDHPFYFMITLQPDLSDPSDMHELFTGVYYGPDH